MRNCRTVRMFSVIAAVGVLVSGFNGSVHGERAHAASAADEPPIPGDTDAGPSWHDQPAEVAQLEDVALIALSRGWTVPEAERKMRLQEKSGPVVGELRLAFPDSFAESRMSDNPDGPITVTFTEDTPERAREIAKPLGQDIVFASGAKISERDALRMSDLISDALVNLGYVEFVTFGDAISGMVSITARRTDGAPQTEGDAISRLPLDLRDHVDLSLTDTTIGSDLHTFGGVTAIATTSGGACTTGFTVRNTATGKHGVTTAAHCYGMNRVYQPWDGVRYEIQFQNEHLGAYGDFEWHHSPTHFHPAKFYVSSNGRREVHGVENDRDFQFSNDYCVYGRVSNVSQCFVVWHPNVTVTTSAGTASRLVAMNARGSLTFGDSGGPWRYGTKSVGITKGSFEFNNDGVQRAVFSKTAWLPTAMSVRVKRWGE